jgi:hypothetical protein
VRGQGSAFKVTDLDSRRGREGGRHIPKEGSRLVSMATILPLIFATPAATRFCEGQIGRVAYRVPMVQDMKCWSRVAGYNEPPYLKCCEHVCGVGV